MLSGRFFSPHQTDLAPYIRLIKRPEYKIGSLSNTGIGCHFWQQRRANTIGNHLDDRGETRCLIGNRHVFLS